MGLFNPNGWETLAIGLILTHITIAAVTIYLHRYQAHRALELSSPVSYFFRIWLWLSTGMVTKEWVAIHRKHHAFCERKDDPHSPVFYGVWRVLFTGVFLYVQETRNPTTMERYSHGTPNDWLENKLLIPHKWMGIVFMLLLDCMFFGVINGAFIWIMQMVWIPFWAAGVINGIGHFYGYRNFASADTSTNIIPWGILIGGEELHNNHHAYATSAKLSQKWYEFDLGWMYIRLLSFFGQAKVKYQAVPPKLVSSKMQLDYAALQTILIHRYDVLAKYLQTLKKFSSSEFARLQLNARDSKLFRHLLIETQPPLEGKLAVPKVADQLAPLLARSEVFSTFVVLRKELEALWQRSHSTQEDLLRQLHAWLARAESSGIRPLEEFALQLRRYA